MIVQLCQGETITEYHVSAIEAQGSWVILFGLEKVTPQELWIPSHEVKYLKVLRSKDQPDPSNRENGMLMTSGGVTRWPNTVENVLR